jgi:hypothetical protein
MNESSSTTNPFANPNGDPIEGKEAEFFAWGRAKELKRRQHLSKEELAGLVAAEDALAQRMNS